MPRTSSFFDRVRKSLADLSQGETSGEKTIEKQAREAQLHEVQHALLILCAEVIKAGKDFPKHTENFVVNYFNQHFGFIHSQKRMHNLRQYLTIGVSPYLKISCTQIKNLSTTDSMEEMLSFLFDVGASNRFLTNSEMRVLQQIQRYLGVSDAVFHSLKKRIENVASPYAVLGIESNATFKEIQTAYRKKVLLHHPDKCQLPMSEEDKHRHFLHIQAAYELLKEQHSNL